MMLIITEDLQSTVYNPNHAVQYGLFIGTPIYIYIYQLYTYIDSFMPNTR